MPEHTATDTGSLAVEVGAHQADSHIVFLGKYITVKFLTVFMFAINATIPCASGQTICFLELAKTICRTASGRDGLVKVLVSASEMAIIG